MAVSFAGDDQSPCPDAAGQRLRRLGGARPGERLRQQRQHQLHLVRRLPRAVARVYSGLSGSFQMSQARTRSSLANAPTTPLHIGFEPGICDAVLQRLRARALHPARVVHARLGRMLRARAAGAGSQQESNSTNIGLDMVLRRDGQKRVDALAESPRHPAARAGRAGTRAWCSCRGLPPSPVPDRCASGSKVSACHISSSLMAVAGM